jgi:hypothetical protein
MKGTWGTIISFLLLVAILVGSAVITNAFARAMYNRCEKCGSLNAKRRKHCRVCNNPIEVK